MNTYLTKSWQKYNIFLLYYIIGVISSLAMVAYPLLFLHRGFSNKQIALLISLSFIASIFQPLIGYITDHFSTSLKSLKYIFIIYTISCLLMFFTSKFFILSFSINSLMRAGMPALIDGYFTSFPDQFNFSYAKVRTSMPIGLGTAFFIANLFLFSFNMTIDGVLIFLSILAIIAMFIVISIPDQQTKLNNTKFSEQTQKTNWCNTFFLILYALLYAGMYQITSSYLSIYFSQFGYSQHFIGNIGLLMLIPQLFLMFN